MTFTPENTTDLFLRSDDTYAFARWGRPLSPVVFGVDDATLPVVKGAIEAIVTLAGHQMAETDPEFGANLMVFFFRDWAELSEVPDLDRMIPELGSLVARLKAENASQYRVFRFDDTGAIKACFSFLRMAGDQAEIPADVLALTHAVQVILLWSDRAFSTASPLAVLPENDTVVVRPEIAAMIRAAYDPVMPPAAQDASHALRLFARMGVAE